MSPHKIGVTISRDVKQIYFSFPHLLTFGEDTVNLWKIHVNSSSLTYVASLSEWIDYPVERGIVIDESRNLVVIPQCDRPVGLSVYNLHDGRLIKKVALFGRISVARIQYDNGRVLVAVNDEDDTWLLVCDLTESDPNRPMFLTEITGSSLTSEGEERPSGFGPVWLSHAGEVVACAGESSGMSMSLMLWPPTDKPNDALPPSRFTKIPRTISVDDEKDGAINMQSATAMGDDRFLMCTVEAVLDVLDGPETYGCVVRVLANPSLETFWASSLISGHIDVLRHVPSLNVVVVIGYISERQNPANGDSPDYALTVTVLDASTGEQRRHERVNFREHGSPVRVCDVSTKAAGGKEVVVGRPDLVVIFCDGGVIVRSLEAFIAEGFPRVESNSSQVEVSRPFGYNFGKSTHAAVGDRHAVVVEDNQKVSLVAW
ncbi:uncharacterized protein EV420DRAFT_1643524 [Desarmillaria tabescens]|uniref:Uncharacterized protein n=1 Tax=Armillaria tabescens TaxID=1929756 RepID=A0AA39N4B1_ARMTA|nr:uncharacterized protein EV420DRAFT_1643524 [Desarmillaria tabescens]KAK0457666.1 hypothetical protein EV420DRAFT_1643524 [Desarmillaria tabescens]